MNTKKQTELLKQASAFAGIVSNKNAIKASIKRTFMELEHERATGDEADTLNYYIELEALTRRLVEILEDEDSKSKRRTKRNI